MLAEREDTGEVVGVAITVPDINQVLAEDEGPAAAVRLAALPQQARTIDRVRVVALGVKPEYQHTGVAAKLYVEHFERGNRSGRRRAARWAGSWRPTSR